eukprot:1666782-Pyramimonas_sp.AAC.1
MAPLWTPWPELDFSCAPAEDAGGHHPVADTVLVEARGGLHVAHRAPRVPALERVGRSALRPQPPAITNRIPTVGLLIVRSLLLDPEVVCEDPEVVCEDPEV